MTTYSKYNIVYRLQKWIDSVPGQTFLNYAYSWGASVVILGTLFKLTHLPGANIMLFIGMGTEVVVFFISAFDRPFDKTAIGKELPTHIGEEDEENEPIGETTADDMHAGGGMQGATIVLGGSGSGAIGAAAAAGESPTAATGGSGGIGGIVIGGGGTATVGGGAATIGGEGQPSAGPTTAAGGMGGIVIGGAGGNGEWAAEQRQASEELAEAQSNYVEELTKLTEILQKVSEQSERLTRDSEEMENLNRTLTGICRVYEMQLRGASQQIGTIEQINDQSRKMAQQIEQLNAIYARMIEAMTVNAK